jgi:hypothetical protein
VNGQCCSTLVVVGALKGNKAAFNASQTLSKTLTHNTHQSTRQQMAVGEDKQQQSPCSD